MVEKGAFPPQMSQRVLDRFIYYGFQRKQHKQTLLRMHAFVAQTQLPVDFHIESVTTAKSL